MIWYNICFSASKILKNEEQAENYLAEFKNRCIKLQDIFEEQA